MNIKCPQMNITLPFTLSSIFTVDKLQRKSLCRPGCFSLLSHVFTFCDFCASEQCNIIKLTSTLKMSQVLIKNGIRVSASQSTITRKNGQLLCKHKPAFSAYSFINKTEKKLLCSDRRQPCTVAPCWWKIRKDPSQVQQWLAPVDPRTYICRTQSWRGAVANL